MLDLLKKKIAKDVNLQVRAYMAFTSNFRVFQFSTSHRVLLMGLRLRDRAVSILKRQSRKNTMSKGEYNK